MTRGPQAAAAIQRRAVAGSFLFKIPGGDEKQARVALFRRSAKVRTYQHKLAPLSGSVEAEDASPIATALREIQEETTLTPSSLELLRVGKPYSFTDESVGREWTINPFAFRLKDPTEGGKGEAGITLDWEHDGVEWFDPLQVKESDEFGGVPKLVDSLRRVWPEHDLGSHAGKILTDGLQNLRNDHESGARQLAAFAISILKNLVNHMDYSTPVGELWWARVRMAAWHICKSRESMGAAITSAVVKALDRIEAIYLLQDLSPEDKVRRMVESMDSQLAERLATTDHICDSLVEFLRQHVLHGTNAKETLSVLTLSSSSTISSCLRRTASALGLSLDLRILESRPLCEGVTLASNLLEAAQDEAGSLILMLYSDASAASAAKSIDVVVLGADRVSTAGDVSNKIGSLPAVLSARHVAPSAKVVVLSETDKIANPGPMDDHEAENNHPAELMKAWKGVVKGAQAIEDALQEGQPARSHGRREVAVRNTYFEWVPARFIDGYATEMGLWNTRDIEEQSRWVGGEMNRFFKDL
ncbi:Uu.00g132550.m01.CDS01 [Anthostomella pinea]|uniref:Uu.00g132550.m01.CDS01 n=1 Tax=Anthostomella pinea TaxID=933095 RepID=A0AAI8VJU1_9PEZI|nr:Uu.00g132550.m01.CDS01 [Anthostomella pinea]